MPLTLAVPLATAVLVAVVGMHVPTVHSSEARRGTAFRNRAPFLAAALGIGIGGLLSALA